MKRKSLLFLLLFALLAPWAANAQETITLTGDLTQAIVPGTTYTFYDSGGPDSNYGTSQNYTATFTCDGEITINFSQFATESSSGCSNWDYMLIYDGTTLLGRGQTGCSDNIVTIGTDIVAESGTLIIEWHSDSSITGAGWTATITGAAPASCPKPTGVAASDPTAHGATISWTGSSDSYIVMVGQPAVANSYDFESNAIPTDFTNDATKPWTVVANTHSGAYCAKSAGGFTSTNSDLVLTVDLAREGSVDFSAMVSSEQNWDYGRFLIDGAQKFEVSGYTNSSWIDYSYPLAAGSHTLTWRYYKDGSGNHGDDCFYVDDIVINMAPATWDETHTASVSPYTFTDLNPETLYIVRVKGVCGGEQSEPSASVSFTTLESCAMPQNLAATTDGATATVTWSGVVDACNIDINGTVTENVTSPYTFNVQLSTTYTIKVQAACGSNWTDPYSFTTPDCLGGHTIEYVLTDTYGDSWNGNAIIISGACDVVVETLANENLDGTTGEETQTGTLVLCGDYYEFTWQTGNYPSEVLFTLIDNGTVIYSNQTGTGLTNGQVLYTIGTLSCVTPSDLTNDEPTVNSVSLRWDENGEAEAWQLCINNDETNLIDVTDDPRYTLEGLTENTTYTVKVRANCGDEHSCWTDAINFTTAERCASPTNLTVSDVTPMGATVTWAGDVNNFNIRYKEIDASQYAIITLKTDDVWGDQTGYQMLLDADATAYGTIIPESGAFSTSDVPYEVYAEFEYKIPMNADGALATSNIVMDNSISIMVPAGTYDWCITNPTPTGTQIAMWIASSNGTAGGRQDDYVFQAGKVYEFYVSMGEENDNTDVTITDFNGTDEGWSTPAPATSPYVFTGLDAETGYAVEIQTVCGGEYGESAWIPVYFVTPSNCVAPFDLDVPQATLMPTSAILSWTGYQENYNVQYRPVAQGATLVDEDFEEDLTWTTIDADGDGYNWVRHVNTGTGNYNTHSGDASVNSGSYDATAGALTPDNYLVSPQVELGGSITFWASAQDPDWPDEHFGVAVSTTSNTDATTFTTIQEWTMTAKKSAGDCKSLYKNKKSGNYLRKNRGDRDGDTWYKYTVDLSAYEGQTGYVAIRHFDCSDNFYLVVDDITIYGPGGGENEWIDARADEASCSITGLESGVTYEWHVQGVNDNCPDGATEWSEIVTFTTPGYCDKPNSFVLDDLTSTSATLSWTGFQDSYNVFYYSAPVEEYLYEDFSTGVSGWMVNSNFSGGRANIGDEDDPWYCVYFNSNGQEQILYSPEMEGVVEGSTLEFTYIAIPASETGSSVQSFYVGFSSDFETFTYGEVTTTSEDEYYGYYQVEVPAGTKYFAIKSTGASDYLCVTDFIVYGPNYQPAGEFGYGDLVVETNSATLEPLEPGKEYYVLVQGICGEGEDDVTDWVAVSIWTLEGYTQTVELFEGWNWFSTYIELDDPVELLQMLENGMGDSGIQIESVIDGVEMNGGDMWAGDLMSIGLMNEHTYMIEVMEDVTVELQGPATNPADHPITIYPNEYSWIGFPSAEEVDVNVALAGLEAEEGDMIETVYGDEGGIIYYYGGVWVGEFDTMIPGRGYIYFSNSDEEKTLIIQTGEEEEEEEGKSSANSTSSLNLNNIKANVRTILDKASKQSKINSANTTQSMYKIQTRFKRAETAILQSKINK